MSLTKLEIQNLLSLQRKKGRSKEGRFMVEGVRLLEETLKSDYLPRIVFYAPSEINQRGQNLVAQFVRKKIETKTISAKECHRLIDTKSSQAIVALFNIKSYDLRQQLQKQPRKILICDKIGDPGNLGALIRSAVAFDFELVVALEGSAEVHNPKTIRSSMGGFFRVPVIGQVKEDDIIDCLRKNGYKIYNADLKGKYISQSLQIDPRAALVVGSEASGSSRTFMDNADYRIKIPMSGKVESLNAAMAGSILMFWMNSGERKIK